MSELQHKILDIILAEVEASENIVRASAVDTELLSEIANPTLPPSPSPKFDVTEKSSGITPSEDFMQIRSTEGGMCTRTRTRNPNPNPNPIPFRSGQWKMLCTTTVLHPPVIFLTPWS